MPVGGVTTRRNITPSSTKSPKDSQKESPRTSDSSPKSTKGKSMQTTMDVIQTQLTEINEELKKTVKVSDIRTIVKGVVEELFSNYEKKMNEEVKKLKEENEKLNQENKELRKEVRNQDQALNEMNNRLEVNERMTKSAMSKANFNEQYSRKNNSVTEHKGEELLQTVNTVLDQVGERIDKSDVLAMHRIPGKKDQPRPIIVKLRSSETKTAVMKKRSDIKRLTLENDGKVKVSDDVTQDNTALISRLLQDHRISAAWYFNGSIYGQCGQRRIKFDIFDDIDQKIRKK